MKTANQLKEEYRALKEERELWKAKKPHLRHLRPDQYKFALDDWQETFDALGDAMQTCVEDAKELRKAA